MLYVFIKKHALVEHFFDGLDVEGDVRVVPYPFTRHGRLTSLLRTIDVYVLWWLSHAWSFDRDFMRLLRGIRHDDSVLYFSIENRKTLQLLSKSIRARKQAAWLWDPVRSYRKSALSRWIYKAWLKSGKIRTCTFDPRDAKEFELELIEQVFRDDSRPGQGETRKDIDLCFIGTDKGRLPELLHWKQAFERRGLRTHFHVVADDRRTYGAEDAKAVTRDWVSYATNLALARRSRCLLELMQSTQSGPTMHSLEALFFNCKLITNNAAIVDCEFYHPSRVFVIGRDREADLPAFIQAPFEAAPTQLLRKHELRSWLSRFK